MFISFLAAGVTFDCVVCSIFGCVNFSIQTKTCFLFVQNHFSLIIFIFRDLQVEQPLERKLSALELGAAENKESNIPLRKSSTVAELQPFPPVSRLEIKNQASSSSLFNYPTNLDHHHDQGLTMNVRAPAAAATLTSAASIATGLGGHSGASDNSANLQSGSSQSKVCNCLYKRL